MERKAHMAIGRALGLAVAQPIMITDFAPLKGVLGTGKVLAGLMNAEGKAHLAIAGAIRWVAAQPSFACAAHSDLLLILLMSFTGFVAAGLPDVFDSGEAAGRDPVGLSWHGIKKDARRVESPFDGLLLLPRTLVAVVIDLITAVGLCVGHLVRCVVRMARPAGLSGSLVGG